MATDWYLGNGGERREQSRSDEGVEFRGRTLLSMHSEGKRKRTKAKGETGREHSVNQRQGKKTNGLYD